MNNDDYFTQPAALPTPVPPPVPGFGLGQYHPHEQDALLEGRRASLQNMRGRAPRLGFWARVEIGLNLARACGDVLRSTPVLMTVPLMSMVVTALLAVGWFASLGGLEAGFEGTRVDVAIKVGPLVLLLNVLGVVAQAVVVDGATSRMTTGTTSLGASWAKTLAALPALAAFGVVFTLERALTGLLRGNRLGQLVANLFDKAWDFATYLAIPAMLYEGIGPFASVKRSAALVRQRWSAQLVAGGALNLAVFLLSLPLVLLAVVVMWAVNPLVGIVLLLGFLLLSVVVSACLSGILSAAMYRYAVTGEIGIGFSEADLWRVFDRSR